MRRRFALVLLVLLSFASVAEACHHGGLFARVRERRSKPHMPFAVRVVAAATHCTPFGCPVR